MPPASPSPETPTIDANREAVSVEAFLAFASDAGYRAGAGHRTAALRDSRLLPLIDAAEGA